ncbi:MAG: DUF1963 domain-containing protein [Planctomycetia bacterium]|nr:DUF1963 domain-containing protein [Planctomycetia bacterium]
MLPLNPFGIPDVPDPDGQDVQAFAAQVELPGDDDCMDTEPWSLSRSADDPGTLDGDWESRWYHGPQAWNWEYGVALLQSVKDRIYVLFADERRDYLIDLRRQGNDLLVGRYVNVGNPEDSGPWAGRIEGPERIVGRWAHGRWDFARKVVHETASQRKLRDKLSGLQRHAWVPIVRVGDGDATASKFSGVPWLGPHEAWPLCPHCRQPLQLLLQLNSKTLPPELDSPFGTGLLQVFFCTNKDARCEEQLVTQLPFSPGHYLRLVEPTGTARLLKPPRLTGRAWNLGFAIRPTVGDGYYQTRLITGWKKVMDYPNDDECKLQGITFDANDDTDFHYPLSGDKLAGWPFWIQQVGYPRCRRCGRQMHFVFQIGSGWNLPDLFGDCGRGFITQCPDHKDELAFQWDS